MESRTNWDTCINTNFPAAVTESSVRKKNMGLNKFWLGAAFGQYRPHVYMLLAQVGYTLLYFITEASFKHGMNPHVYVTYRHIVSGIVMLPFAYFLERKIRPTLTLPLFVELFVLSLLGLESLIIKSPKGMAKIFGTLISLAGVMTMSLYKGPVLKNLRHAPIHIQGNSVIHEEWVKGSILTVASCITWSIWYIMQAVTLKRYPAQLSLTTWMSFLGAAQSAVFTVIVEHKPSAWALGFNVDLWSVLYGGVIVSGVIIFIQLWCTEQKGPVFVTMFNPVSTVLVAFLAYFVFGERLYTGSIIGSVIVIIGLYLVLWGKEEAQKNQKTTQCCSGEGNEDTQDKNFYLEEKTDVP